MADIIIGGIIIVAVAAVIIKKIRDKKSGKSGCGCGCGGCAGKSRCFERQKDSDEPGGN